MITNVHAPSRLQHQYCGMLESWPYSELSYIWEACRATKKIIFMGQGMQPPLDVVLVLAGAYSCIQQSPHLVPSVPLCLLPVDLVKALGLTQLVNLQIARRCGYGAF